MEGVVLEKVITARGTITAGIMGKVIMDALGKGGVKNDIQGSG